MVAVYMLRVTCRVERASGQKDKFSSSALTLQVNLALKEPD